MNTTLGTEKIWAQFIESHNADLKLRQVRSKELLDVIDTFFTTIQEWIDKNRLDFEWVELAKPELIKWYYRRVLSKHNKRLKNEDFLMEWSYQYDSLVVKLQNGNLMVISIALSKYRDVDKFRVGIFRPKTIMEILSSGMDFSLFMEYHAKEFYSIDECMRFFLSSYHKK